MRGRSLRVLERVLWLVWAIGTGALVWLLLVFPYETRAGAGGRDFVVEVGAHPTIDSLAKVLEQEGVVTRPLAFTLFMRLVVDDADLRAKTVVANRALPLTQLLPRLVTNRGRALVNVPLPEGFTSFDMATRLDRFGIAPRDALLAAMRDRALLESAGLKADSAEGYLFPATYALRQDEHPRDVVRRLLREFRRRTDPLFDAYARAHDGAPFSLTPHELVTLASIVEREAHAAEERSVIAGVFLNRLANPTFRPHRLQADPTVAYGCLVAPDAAPTCREFDGRRITPAMVRDPANPYNTYRIEGLPPGPIANPGIASLEAALDPAEHDFFYFVTKGGGLHAFSRTLDEHNARIRGEP